MKKSSIDLDKLADEVVGWFPTLSKEEQRVSIQLYRLLAEGNPASVQEIAARLRLSKETVSQTLHQWPGVYYNDHGQVIGYWGLALPQMNHRFEVEGRTLYTWCAWDSLFLPQIIRTTARVASICPVTGAPIHLTVAPEGVRSIHPPGVVMSFMIPETASVQEDVILHFCHYVHFFVSPEAGAKWVSKNEGTFLLSLEEAVTLGRMKNEAQYGALLQAD